MKKFIFVGILLLLTSCRSHAPRETPTSTTPPPPVTHVPLNEAPPPPQTPAPVPVPHQEPRKVALILGPGGGKAFAHVGVLKALLQQRVPIDKVVGLEWGSLVGALYASRGQVHEVEWKLYKMQQKGLPRAKGLFGRTTESTLKVMDEFLAESFGKDLVTTSKIPFECPSKSVWSGVVNWQDRGPLKDAVKRCLGFPPTFKVQGSFVAGASQAGESVERLRAQGYQLIVIVNVLGSALPTPQESAIDNLDTVLLWQEVRRATLQAEKMEVETINVDTSNSPVIQFESAKELEALGEVAGQKAAAQLISKYGF